MSAILAAWQRHPAHRNLSLPTNPTERDAYILRVAASWRRSTEAAVIEAIADWQASTGPARDKARARVRPAAASYRAAMRLYHDVWRAFCAGRQAVKEAA